MTDLQRQADILYHLYESFNKNEAQTYTSLKRMDNLVYIPDEELKAELVYLTKSGYVEKTPSEELNLSAKGVRATELLYKKFISYVKKLYGKELSYWINIFDYWKNNTTKLISEVYFRIQREPQIRNAFNEYLGSLDNVENIESYEVKVPEITRPPLDKTKEHTKNLEKIQVFISYAKEDCTKALRLYNDLSADERLNPWIDKKSLLPGEKWKVTISNAIVKSRFFIALLSSNSVDKVGYVQKELKEALQILDIYPESKVFIIPVRLDDCKVSDSRLKEINYVDLFPTWEEGFKKILQTIDIYS